MSGGPVFLERDEKLYFTGQYSGLIYPDHVMKQSEKSTALGTCVDLSHIFNSLSMARVPG